MQNEVAVKIGDILTRIIVSLPKGGVLKVNTTKHEVSRLFGENGMHIDNTWFKVYKDWFGEIRKHYEENGYAVEVFLYGDNSGRNVVYEKLMIEELKKRINEDYIVMLKTKQTIEAGTVEYISEVDKTPWGIDKSSLDNSN